ncbi:ABC-F family ATP-binding cassette domain-containing protein [Quadrisphaera setariae]|uniref:ABC-F family ATP-binding cassette domain-containing protein n=1 Tax=Quadrisphaera setariae TaxID=2593304 RepID=A0A5C8ZEU8_9ACTN|nr:ABC-F family ATP-binding cassette domain-containing protein [Quadrisphaera setariae]TXR56362.1 ABC-F family ATP-binding cassette domain-containing protein [Quadrisphaera setariae]
MAHLLNLEGATVVHGARTVLDGVSLGLDDGARVGVVGRNGDGKSTLLRVLAGTQVLDGGRATRSRGTTMGVLSQTDDLDPSHTVRRAVVGDVPDHVWASDARIRSVLDGLLGDMLEGPAAAPGGAEALVGQLSGGQRRRVALARLMAGDDDVLLLDEPTNHLDVEGVAWLAEHLRTRWQPSQGALVVVTHDRWFLDAVVERTWEVHDGVVDSYDGGYAAYVLARAERARIASVTAERRDNLLRKELAWLRRGAPARTSKPRFRIEAANALIAAEPPPRDSFALARTATARLGKDVVDVEGASLAVGEGDERRVLLDDVTWRLGPGDRIGVVGVNGSGKTTLLKLLLQQVQPDAGRVKLGKTVVTGVLSQDLRELDAVADQRVLETVEREATSVLDVATGKELTASSVVERLGFPAARAWTHVHDLSGGERRRLQLARLLVRGPNLLLLDEPTNDLDTDTLAAVEDVLDGFAGTLVVVSHDRYLLERTTDRQVALLGDGAIRDLPGGVEEYLRLRHAGAGVAGAAATSVATASSSSRDDRGGSTQPTGASAADARAARKEVARLERQLAKLSEKEAKLHDALAASAADYAAAAKLDAELRELLSEKEALEEEWLEAAEAAG